MTEIRLPTPVEAAYVGAMVDGEGGADHYHTRNGVNRGRCTSRIQVNNTEVEYISAVLRAVGAGRVHLHHPSQSQLGKKLVWTWTIAAHRLVRQLAARLLPYSIKVQRLVASWQEGCCE